MGFYGTGMNECPNFVVRDVACLLIAFSDQWFMGD